MSGQLRVKAGVSLHMAFRRNVIVLPYIYIYIYEVEESGSLALMAANNGSRRQVSDVHVIVFPVLSPESQTQVSPIPVTI